MKEIIQQVIDSLTEKGVEPGLAVAYIIVSVLLAIMAAVALVMHLRVFFNYMSTNRIKTSAGKKSFEVARDALDRAGLNHIQVKKANFIRALVFGNCYSITKKTIFLRRTIANKDSLTAVGLALQKVGIAKMCEDDVKMAKTRNIFQIIGLFGPFLFVPVILISAIIDFILFQSFGVFSIIGLIISGIILSSGFIVTLLNIPVEKKAQTIALQIIDETHLLNEEERAAVVKVFKTYIIAYICDFIVEVLRLVQFILEILINSRISSNSNN